MTALTWITSFASYMLYGCATTLLGIYIGARVANNNWLMSAGQHRLYRTAYCCRGKFYYVVPESEYVHHVTAPRSE